MIKYNTINVYGTGIFYKALRKCVALQTIVFYFWRAQRDSAEKTSKFGLNTFRSTKAEVSV